MSKLLPLAGVAALTAVGGFTHTSGKDGKISFPIGISSGVNSFSLSHHFTDPGSTTSTPSSNPTTIDNVGDYFSCPLYGPFKVGDPDFTATFDYRANILNQEIIERLRIIDAGNGNALHGATHASFLYENNALITTSFNIPIRDYFTSSGITLKFEIVSKSSRAVLKEYGTTIYPLIDYQPSYSSLMRGTYRTNPMGFYGDGEGMKSTDEFFDFSTIGEYLETNYYYRLPINSLVPYYNSKFPLSYSSITLRFNDSENIFPRFTHDRFRDIRIPLTATVEGDVHKVVLNYKNVFYVDRKTLQMSDTYYSNYLLSREFYLPINGMKSFNNKLLYLEFEDFGQSQITMSFPVRYITDHALVGLVDEGIHYIEGGSK